MKHNYLTQKQIFFPDLIFVAFCLCCILSQSKAMDPKTKKSTNSLKTRETTLYRILFEAIEMGDSQEAQKYVEAIHQEGFDINCFNSLHETPFLAASRNGLVDLLPILQEYGAKPEAFNREGFSSLMLAASHGHVNVTQFLLDNVEEEHKSEFINFQNRKKETALLCAIENGHPDVVEVLIQEGAYTFTKDMFGFNALRLANLPELRETNPEAMDRIYQILMHSRAFKGFKKFKVIKKKNLL